jgi:hypothetical protein
MKVKFYHPDPDTKRASGFLNAKVSFFLMFCPVPNVPVHSYKIVATLKVFAHIVMARKRGGGEGVSDDLVNQLPSQVLRMIKASSQQ